MLYVGEKQGRGPQQQSRREFFLEFVNSSELMDLELKGYGLLGQVTQGKVI